MQLIKAQMPHLNACSEVLIETIEIGLERAPFVVFVNFFPHLYMYKPADYGPQQH
jgi:hypothetical protein